MVLIFQIMILLRWDCGNHPCVSMTELLEWERDVMCRLFLRGWPLLDECGKVLSEV